MQLIKDFIWMTITALLFLFAVNAAARAQYIYCDAEPFLCKASASVYTDPNGNYVARKGKSGHLMTGFFDANGVKTVRVTRAGLYITKYEEYFLLSLFGLVIAAVAATVIPVMRRDQYDGRSSDSEISDFFKRLNERSRTSSTTPETFSYGGVRKPLREITGPSTPPIPDFICARRKQLPVPPVSVSRPVPRRTDRAGYIPHHREVHLGHSSDTAIGAYARRLFKDGDPTL